jgi:hypothetical protein
VAAPGRLAAVTGLLPPYDRPLWTDDDVDRRVAALVGRAARDDTLWLLFVDGDDRQAPVVMPVEELSGPPVDELIVGLGDVLAGFLPDLATQAGPGSVVFVRERLGPDDPVAADLAWAAALGAMCRSRGIPVRGIHLSTPGAVRRMP